MTVRRSSPKAASARTKASRKKAAPIPTHLKALGVYGFETQELAVLSALVTCDPLLLIGRSGTGKTYLLNSLSEALHLEHRHYNASLISFDDLVGFPYPDETKSTIRFLETPATIWGAESVLVDEISRCKPEHQNRLFSLVHERRIQGIPLEKLRYRWAAMNPCSSDQGGSEDYMGSEPLDPALADRFSVIVEVGDWDGLSDEDRKLVADPSGEGAMSDDSGHLAADLATWQKQFEQQLPECPVQVIDYVCAVVTVLGDAGIRLSPRRARLMTRTLLAARIIAGELEFESVRTLLCYSIPHQAWGEAPDIARVSAAHQTAWDAAFLKGERKWVHMFHMERDLGKKARQLLQHCPSPDAGSLAVEQLLANEPKERAAAFALAAFPAAAAGKLPVGAEGVNDLGRLAQELLTVTGEITWQERMGGNNHLRSPEMSRLSSVLVKLKGARQERACQLFYWCLVNELVLKDPVALEEQFQRCVRVFARVGAK